MRTLREELPDVLPLLRRRALRLTRSRTRAEDLVQDATLRALRFEGRFVPGSSARAWMLKILDNTFLSERRRALLEQRVLGRAGSEPGAWPASSSVELTPGLTRGTERAIGELGAPFAEVVRLVDIEGQSYAEAAELLGVPLGTVMSRLFRARGRLRHTLGAPISTLSSAAT